jgi:multicomponent Na+:H+ antiporter subunit E
MAHALSLLLVCFATWLLLSGHFSSPLLLSFGVLSSLVVAFIAWRTERVDPETPTLRLNLHPHILLYWPWLLWQIIKSNLDVAKIILDPKLPISPTMIRIKAPQRTDLARVIYANSVTLTPGTVTTYLKGHVMEVHALTREAADAVLEGEMSRRVSQLEAND